LRELFARGIVAPYQVENPIFFSFCQNFRKWSTCSEGEKDPLQGKEQQEAHLHKVTQYKARLQLAQVSFMLTLIIECMRLVNKHGENDEQILCSGKRR
jgi:hypothetical protein